MIPLLFYAVLPCYFIRLSRPLQLIVALKHTPPYSEPIEAVDSYNKGKKEAPAIIRSKGTSMIKFLIKTYKIRQKFNVYSW